jgi:hypothetical protein
LLAAAASIDAAAKKLAELPPRAPSERQLLSGDFACSHVSVGIRVGVSVGVRVGVGFGVVVKIVLTLHLG